MKCISAIAVLILASFLHSHAYSDSGADSRFIDHGSFAVTYSPGLTPAARQAASLYPYMLSEIEDTLGIQMSHNKVLVAILDREEFKSISGGRPVMAIAMPSKGALFLDYDALGADLMVFRATLKHEIVHMTIHTEGGGAIPKWLDEGISQWASGGHSEIRQTGSSWLISKAALTGRLMPLESLELSFPASEKGMQLAYSESLSAVDMIVSEYGASVISRILKDIHAGNSASASFYSHTGETLDEFSSRWEHSVRNRAGILSFLKAHFYEALFLIAAIALTIGFIRSIYRIRTYKDTEGEEEPLNPDSEHRQ